MQDALYHSCQWLIRLTHIYLQTYFVSIPKYKSTRMLVQIQGESSFSEIVNENVRICHFDFQLEIQLYYQTVHKPYPVDLMLKQHCKSQQFSKAIMLKIQLLASAKQILPESPLMRQFVSPLSELLIRWSKSMDVCHACRNTINSEANFHQSLIILDGFQGVNRRGMTIYEQSIDNLKSVLTLAVDLIMKKAFCVNKNVYQITSSQE